MGSASKRHGKKAWRTLDASAVEDTLAAAALAAKSVAHVATLPDDALFFLDTKPSARACPHASFIAPATGRRSSLLPLPLPHPSSHAAPKRLSRRERVAAKGPLKVDAILQRNPLLHFPVPTAPRPSVRTPSPCLWLLLLTLCNVLTPCASRTCGRSARAPRAAVEQALRW